MVPSLPSHRQRQMQDSLEVSRVIHPPQRRLQEAVPVIDAVIACTMSKSENSFSYNRIVSVLSAGPILTGVSLL